jgi:hypothetical protein
MTEKKSNDKILIILLALALFISIINSYEISQIRPVSSISSSGTISDVIPTGVPEIYGEELGVSFDDVSPNDRYKADATIAKLANLDKTITLTGKDKERYINILYKLENGISCEYCCGARAAIFENGEPACGCAHSYAMRGLAKYLITKHGDEYTDEEILEEVGKWKTLFFPGQMTQKAKILESKGIEVNYINLASNKYRGIERGTGGSGGMVGGC